MSVSGLARAVSLDVVGAEGRGRILVALLRGPSPKYCTRKANREQTDSI